jgi:osmotically-inducible protein OsmY
MRSTPLLIVAALAGMLLLEHAARAQAPTANRAASTISSSSGAIQGLGGMNRAQTNMATNSAQKSASSTGTGTGTNASTANPLQGDEWFIRRSHGRGAFVGADSSDKLGFVGDQQAAVGGAVKSAISALRAAKTAASVNAPLLPRRKTDLYDPRLQMEFEYAPPAVETISSTLAHRLEASKSIRWVGPLAVSMEGQTATLRGTVASERDRALAEQFALFEPGIVAVRNLLTVQSPTTPYVPATQK